MAEHELGVAGRRTPHQQNNRAQNVQENTNAHKADRNTPRIYSSLAVGSERNPRQSAQSLLIT